MNKIIRYSSQIKILKRSLFFIPNTTFNYVPFFPYSSKQKEKTQKKIEKEEVYEHISNMDTMAEQEELTNDQLNLFMKDRRDQIDLVAEETIIPRNAFITAALITMPIIIGGPLLNVFCFQNLFLDQLPSLFTAFLKYNSVQLSFMVKT